MAQPPRSGGRGILNLHQSLAKLAENNKDNKNEPSFGRGRSLHLLEALQSLPGEATANPSWGRGRAQINLQSLLKTVTQHGQESSALSTKSEGSSSGGSHKSVYETLTAGRGISPSKNTSSRVFEVDKKLEKLSIESKHSGSEKDSNTRTNYLPVKKLGESGHQVDVTANYIRLNVSPGHGAFEYRVKFEPQTDYRGFCIKMLHEHTSVLGKGLTFDGTTLYLSTRLPKDHTVLISKHPTEQFDVELDITFVKEKPLREMTHLYNVLFKQIMNELKLKRIGQYNFDPNAAQMIPQHKLQVWPGYVTAVAEYEDGLMLNLDPMHRVLRTQSVLSEIKEISGRCHNNVEDAIKSALIGKSVLTTYNCNLYTVDDIDFSSNPLSTFEKANGEQISYCQYYKVNYDRHVLDLKQPLLVSRNRVKVDNKVVERLICLMPELCNLTGLSDDMKKDFRLMKDLAAYTRITPNQRYQALKSFIENVNNNPKASERLKNWGLSLAPTPINLVARALAPESIHFGSNKNVKGTTNANWSKETTMYPVITPVDIDNWVVLYTQKDANASRDLVECIVRCGPPMGISIQKPQMILLKSDKIDEYVMTIRKVINNNLQLVVCICPSSRDDRYKAIKTTCCLDNPIPSQVINGFTISKSNRLRSVSQKILLQLNCKLGGTLWSVAIPFKKVMVVGLDVYHSAAQNAKSVCGFVASYDTNITRWYSRVCLQRPGQEIFDQVKQCLKDALNLYLRKNGFYPDRIIFYRDGVGDGQLNICEEYEVPQLISGFNELDANYNPALTYIIVQKRNNTRIFAGKPGSNLDNPLPGTVLDHTINRKYLYDFYVVSQKVNEGTIVPTHYIVVRDDSTMTPDHVQRFTFKMCHLYYNWPGTVRVPAPCQYAHKLAYLVGCSLGKEHDPILGDRLFFL